jgi:uncharacterized protein
MEEFTPWASTLGGVLIGTSAAIMLIALGRIAGVSGILGGLLARPAGDSAWRFAFVLGLVLGGLGMYAVSPQLFAVRTGHGLTTVAMAGLLVGLGTRMGGGCTSGHGVCGIGRGSRRSIAATLTFVVTGMLTVFVVKHLLGAG